MRLGLGLALVLLAVGQAAAWDCPGGVKGSDQVTGYTSFFGIKSDKSLKYVDQIGAWKKFGAITKINLFADAECIAGIKLTYGYDARNAQMLGTEHVAKQAHLNMMAYEHITKVEIRLGASKCVEWIRLTTTKGKSVMLGNVNTATAVQVGTANREGGFLAAIRGYEEASKGPMQQLQFVWGVGICPEAIPAPVAPTPEPVPAAPAPEAAVPDAGEAPPAAPVDAPMDAPPAAPLPEVPEPEGPFCLPETDKCDTTAASGPASCPYVAPFTNNVCVGGCCMSAGKCRRGFCGSAGLGVEVMQPNTMCWGTNSGFMHSRNACKNMACKLAVPGCVTDLISGSCVGTVVPMTTDVDESMSKWIGFPCLQTVPGGLPVDALGKNDVHGAYADKLWSICNCKSGRLIPSHGSNSTKCHGPMCDLFKLPELPSLNFALPGFRMSDMGALIDLKDMDWTALNDIARPQFTLPKVSVKVPDVKAVINEFRSYLNGTTQMLDPIIGGVITGGGYPSLTINITRPELPTVTINSIQPGVGLNETIPQVRMALPGHANTLNFTKLGVQETKDIEALLKAFHVNTQVMGAVPKEVLDAAFNVPEQAAAIAAMPVQEMVDSISKN